MAVGYWRDLIKGIRQLPPAQRRELERLAWQQARVRFLGWFPATIDWMRVWLIKLLAGNGSVLINIQIIGPGNTLRMSSRALIDGVSLDRSTPAEDSVIAIIGDDHGTTIALDQGD